VSRDYLAADEARINAELIAAPGKAGGHRRLLPARSGQDIGGDAASLAELWRGVSALPPDA
jgi:hypothetical protein